jgi:hypothetical protein
MRIADLVSVCGSIAIFIDLRHLVACESIAILVDLFFRLLDHVHLKSDSYQSHRCLSLSLSGLHTFDGNKSVGTNSARDGPNFAHNTLS